MTRRQALTAVGAVVAGHMGQTTTSQAVTFNLLEPTTLSFNLDTYSAYVFRQGDRTVTVTPKELMAALKGDQ